MNKPNITPSLDRGLQRKHDYETICNGSDCFEPATEQIRVSAGRFGQIELDLCGSCITKFRTTKNKKKEWGVS